MGRNYSKCMKFKIIPYCSNLKCYDYDGVDYVKRKK